MQQPVPETGVIMKIETKDTAGNANGYLVPIWNALENPELRPEQVYLTAVAPHTRKGPHLHMKRSGCFICIKGNVKIVTRAPGAIGYVVAATGEHNQYRRIVVKPGTAAAIYNSGDEEALVLNLPSPAWSAAEPDEWPVEDWYDPAVCR
jgi:hypothetical protein